MANIDYTDGPGPQHAPAQPRGEGLTLGQVMSIAGALTSLALVIGVGVWGYRLVMRDVSGVPVVRALEGPMRIQPEDPGGEAVDYQGLAVNRIAAEGSAAPPPERLILAPRPVELTSEDVPVAAAVPGRPAAGATAAVEGATGGAVQGLSDSEVAALLRNLTGADAPGDGTPADTSADAGGAAGQVTPVAMRVEAPLPAATGAVPAPSRDEASVVDRAGISPAVLAAPGVKVSLRPRPRPHPAVAVAENSASRAAAIAAALREATSVEIAASELPLGTALAQLGAFETAELARDAWERVSTRFGDYMQDKRRVVQKASSGGRVFYRLRVAGFDDLGDARRFCAALEAENAECVPVVLR